MTRALSIEQREKIVNAYQQGLGTAVEIAEIFGITKRSVFNYVRLFNETGSLLPKPSPGRPPILTTENLAIIKNIILDNMDWTLEQYKEKFYELTDIDVTIATIHNACNILNLRRKKKLFRGGARKE